MRWPGQSADRPTDSDVVDDSVTPSTDAGQEAFRTYVVPQIEMLLRVGYSLTGSWADSEDLVQDTLIRAWRAIDRFDGRHPRAWLLTILRRAHLNSVRRQRPQTTDDEELLQRSRSVFGSATAPSAEEVVTERDLSPQLEQAVQALDPRFRTVLLLVDVQQLSYAEAAAALGVPVGTVYSRLSRARDRIRKQLNDVRSDRRRW